MRFPDRSRVPDGCLSSPSLIQGALYSEPINRNACISETLCSCLSASSLEEPRSASAADIIDVKRPAGRVARRKLPWVIRAIAKMTDKPVLSPRSGTTTGPVAPPSPPSVRAAAGADYIRVRTDGRRALDQAECLCESGGACGQGELPAKKVVIAAYSDFERLGTVSPFSVVRSPPGGC